MVHIVQTTLPHRALCSLETFDSDVRLCFNLRHFGCSVETSSAWHNLWWTWTALNFIQFYSSAYITSLSGLASADNPHLEWSIGKFGFICLHYLREVYTGFPDPTENLVSEVGYNHSFGLLIEATTDADKAHLLSHLLLMQHLGLK